MHDLIAKYGFDLTGLRTRQRRNNSIIRLNTHGHAILTQTETSSMIQLFLFKLNSYQAVLSEEDIMNVIHHEFPDSILKYACIGEISQSKTTKPTLGIQIILRKVVNRRVWFLDSITSMLIHSTVNNEIQREENIEFYRNNFCISFDR